jgi:phospholipid-binding lipoprotein MlaA
MGISALTTAMTVAAATVPAGESPASLAPPVSEPITADSGPSDSARESGAPLILLAQSTGPEATGQPTAQPQSPSPPEAEPAPPSTPDGDQEQIIVTGRKPSPDDPLEELNVETFKVTRAVDESLIAPVAFAYEDIMPRPVRKGLRNFLRNLGEPIVFVNYLLQLKPDKAAETLGRFLINTTVGVAGVVDVAKKKPFFLPHRSNGFANTLGYYGVKAGPYFYLPLLGPTTLRDFIGDRLDLFLLPSFYGKLLQRREIFVPIAVLGALDHRLEIDDNLKAIRASRDPYLGTRTYYLQKRQAEIDALRGRKAQNSTPPAPGAKPVPSGRSPIQYPPRAGSTGAAGGPLLGSVSIKFGVRMGWATPTFPAPSAA